MKIGDKVRIVKYANHGKGLSKDIFKIVTGDIKFINKNFITVQYENYREAFNLTDMVNKRNYILQIRKDKEWQNVTVEDINNTLGLQHLAQKGKFLFKEQYVNNYEKEQKVEAILRKSKMVSGQANK